MTSDGVNSYTWDRANRLLSMGSASYQYDGEGRRVQQTVSSTVTKYLLDIQPGLAVVLSETTGANTMRYVHSPRGIHAHKDTGGNWEWMVQDGLGSVREVVDNSVGVLWSTNYDPYGNPFGATGTGQTGYGFTGEQTDTNGQVYLRARYYNPNIGVFTARDSFEGRYDRAMTLNGYNWVEGNVPNRIDPSGLSSCQVQPLPCPSASQYVPNANYDLRKYVDTSYSSRDWLDDIVGLLHTFEHSIQYYGLQEVANRAEIAGNVHAAQNLRHWLDNSGTRVDNYDVENMLQTLPKWRDDIRDNILNPSVFDLVNIASPSAEPVPGCKLYQNNTAGGLNPRTGQYDTWRRAGQGSANRTTDANIYGPNGISTAPGSGGFQAMYGDLPANADFTRAEFDYFIAMNAFDYSLSESVMVNEATGDAEVCYRIDIADEYGWYVNEGTGALDELLAGAEKDRIGTHYEIRGASMIKCQRFNIRQAVGTKSYGLKVPGG